MRDLFVQSEEKVTAHTILKLYGQLTEFAEEGSNRRRKEKETIIWWREFVCDLEGKPGMINYVPLNCLQIAFHSSGNVLLFSMEI
jgi:hypothetical protein